MLVDDEVSVIEAVASMLIHLGYNLLTASDGQTAIDQFKNPLPSNNFPIN